MGNCCECLGRGKEAKGPDAPLEGLVFARGESLVVAPDGKVSRVVLQSSSEEEPGDLLPAAARNVKVYGEDGIKTPIGSRDPEASSAAGTSRLGLNPMGLPDMSAVGADGPSPAETPPIRPMTGTTAGGPGDWGPPPTLLQGFPGAAVPPQPEMQPPEGTLQSIPQQQPDFFPQDNAFQQQQQWAPQQPWEAQQQWQPQQPWQLQQPWQQQQPGEPQQPWQQQQPGEPQQPWLSQQWQFQQPQGLQGPPGPPGPPGPQGPQEGQPPQAETQSGRMFSFGNMAAAALSAIGITEDTSPAQAKAAPKASNSQQLQIPQLTPAGPRQGELFHSARSDVSGRTEGTILPVWGYFSR